MHTDRLSQKTLICMRTTLKNIASTAKKLCLKKINETPPNKSDYSLQTFATLHYKSMCTEST